MALNWYQGGKSSTRKNAPAMGGGLGQHQGTDFILDPQWGAGGTTFQGTLNKGAVDALKGAMSSANPEDVAAQDALRDYWTTALGDVGANARGQMNQFDTQSQRGLANLLSQQRASQAGTGLIGSRQASNQAGDITQRLASQYMQGVTANRQQELQNAGGIQRALSGIYGQDLQERNYQMNQARALADQYNTMWNQQQTREGALAAARGPESNWVADIAPLVGAGVGAAFGNPMLGYGLGSAAGGAIGGGGGGGGGGSNLAMLLAMQNSSVGGGLPKESPYLGDYSGGGGGGYSNPYLNPAWQQQGYF